MNPDTLFPGRTAAFVLIPLTVAASVVLGWNTLPQYEKAHGSDYRQVTPAPVGDAGVGREFGELP